MSEGARSVKSVRIRADGSRARTPLWFKTTKNSSVTKRASLLLYSEKYSSAVSPGAQGVATKARNSRKTWKNLGDNSFEGLGEFARADVFGRPYSGNAE